MTRAEADRFWPPRPGTGTTVLLTYDWSGVPDEGLKQQVGFPLEKAEQLDATLDNLAQAVAT